MFKIIYIINNIKVNNLTNLKINIKEPEEEYEIQVSSKTTHK